MARIGRRWVDRLILAGCVGVSLVVAGAQFHVGPFSDDDYPGGLPADFEDPPAGGPTTGSIATEGAKPLAPGVLLHPGADGTLPVSVRWVRHLAAPEAFAVYGDDVYVADETALDLDVADGSTRWDVGDPAGDGLAADGGVQIGLEGEDRVRFWAPYNFDLTVDRGSGGLVGLSHSTGGDLPDDIAVLPVARPTVYRVTNGLDEVIGRTQGRVAWSISVAEPEFDTQAPVAVPGGIVLALSSGDLVVLDTP